MLKILFILQLKAKTYYFRKAVTHEGGLVVTLAFAYIGVFK